MLSSLAAQYSRTDKNSSYRTVIKTIMLIYRGEAGAAQLEHWEF